MANSQLHVSDSEMEIWKWKEKRNLDINTVRFKIYTFLSAGVIELSPPLLVRPPDQHGENLLRQTMDEQDEQYGW